MARDSTFGQIFLNTLLECKLDPDPALSRNIKPLIQQLIKREYERLYEEFDWPFLRVKVDVTLQSGDRYYDFPVNLDLDRIENVDYYFGGLWFPLERGIGDTDYNTYNSDNGVGSDPACKWDVINTGSGAQMEIWPMPSSGATKIRLTGIQKRRLLVADADTCDLDDTMIMLFAASEYLASKAAPEAQVKQQKAVERYRTIKGRCIQTRTNSFSFSSPSAPSSNDRVPLVAYVRAP